MPALVSALKSVDLPTLGKPTMPHFKLMEILGIGISITTLARGHTPAGAAREVDHPAKAQPCRKGAYCTVAAQGCRRSRRGGSACALPPIVHNPAAIMLFMRGHSQTFQALVVGGGLVGKAAALSRPQIGMRVALLAEPASPLAPGARFDSRVYAFSSSSQAFLERLRVWQALDATRIVPVYYMWLV